MSGLISGSLPGGWIYWWQMKPHRNILKLSAILALAAWANVQVMACCWSFSSAHTAPVVAEVAPEHACCQHASMPVLVIPDGAGLISEAGTSCCNHDETPVLKSSTSSLDVTLAAGPDLLQIPFQTSENFHRATAYRGSGPPSSLVFQRLLV